MTASSHAVRPHPHFKKVTTIIRFYLGASCFSAVTEKASPSSNTQLVIGVLVYVPVTTHNTTTSWTEEACLS